MSSPPPDRLPVQRFTLTAAPPVRALAIAAAAELLGALLLTGRLRTQVELGADTLTVTRAGQRREVSWSDVRAVTLQHPRLRVTTADPAGGVVITNPRRESDPRFAALMSALRQRLDADRGYQTTTW